MRVLHFSDLHIGVENYGRTDPNTGLSTRLGDFLAALDELVEFALSNQVDLVVLAGDAYKGRDPSQTHQREFAIRLRRLSAAGIPTFLLAGNHDLPAMASRANAVEIFATLDVPNVYVGSRLANHTISTPAGPVQIVAVPWPTRGAMLARDESRGLSIEQIRQATEDRMTAAIMRNVETLDPDTPAILTGHVTVNGATTGTERSMMLGNDHVLNMSAIGQPQLEYVALGHIHKHQVLRAAAPVVAYSGSLQRVDFSEESDDKGFCVADINPQAPQGRRLQDFQFHPIGARPFVTVAATVPDVEANPTDFVVRAIGRREVAGAIVRLRITLSGEQSARLRDADLRPALSSAHYVASISREVTDQERRRAPIDSSDLQPMAALRMYLESRGVNADRQQLMLERAEQLLSDIQAGE
jgi:exonuclease SbcD